MKLINYMNLNQHPIQLSFKKDRTYEFEEVYHSHQGMEILYVHSGRGKIITGGKIMELKKGMMFYYRPFHMHRVQIDLNKEPYIRSLFVFEPSIIEKYLQQFSGLQAFFKEFFKEPFAQVTLTEIPQNKLEALISEYSTWVTVTNSIEALEVEALFVISFINLLRHYSSNDILDLKIKISYKTTDSIKLALDWLEQHFMEEFHLDKLAQEVHLSPNYLSNVFRKEIGSSISDYLAVRRIQEACMLLKTTSLSVLDIGQRVGLNNTSYFCKFFKKYVGMTPYNFKKLNGNL